ncbi:MAG: GntR family transcriptional regulator, partial [Tissierellia bacterium]|nr:GntR family transcriptional regulator [Tissierellia bacterium]
KIVSNELVENDVLPSIRGLARDLKISVITTKRAYDELEKDGFIYTIPSKGSYVKGTNLELLKEEYLKEVEMSLRKAKESGYLAGIDNKELLEIFAYILEDN